MLRFRLFGTDVAVKAVALGYVLPVWAIVTWLGWRWHPERSLLQALLIGLLGAGLMLFADFGHPIGHIFSARYAGAPMDEVLLSGEMPRTLYSHNDVPANVHRLRAIGGPLFNLLGLLLSLAVYLPTPGTSVIHELAGWSALAHGLMIPMSLTPLPIFDGGTLLKWTLVQGGRAPAEADRVIRRVDWVLAALAAGAGLVLLMAGAWLAGLLCLGISVAVAAITMRTRPDTR